MKKETAEKILNETEAGYDLISGKFSATRKHFWRGLEWIGDHVRDGDRVLDFGCGNGRLLELFGEKKIDYVGVDVSEKLIEIAKQKHVQENITFQKISGQGTLALPDDYFNAVYSIAVFHHLPSEEHRKEITAELFRVLKPGGRAVIAVWNLWQGKYLKNLLSSWLSKLSGRSDLDWKDCRITFTDNQGQVFSRYHHAFTKRELKKLFERAGFEVEKCETAGGRNLVLVGRKLPSGGNVVK
jgi:tRNA (uracil-5-)-methyltransferase TRM9